MARFLLMNFAAPGHLNPALAIVSELVSYGADVVCVLPDSCREAVEQAGASLAKLTGQPGPAAPPHDDQELALLPYELMERGAGMMPELLDLIDRDRPDCILYNSLFVPGALAARLSKIRAAALRPYHAPLAPRAVGPPYASDDLAVRGRAIDARLAALCHDRGEPPLSLRDLVSTIEPLTLVTMPRAFQHGEAAFDDRFQFVGPCLPAARPPKNLFSGETSSLTRNLYISLGTNHPPDPEFFGLCQEAFQSGDWNTVLAIGPRDAPQASGGAAGWFRMAAYAPQLSVLAEADIFITHGGLNSTMEALYYGVPLVVIPRNREQRLTAQRVRDLGLGVMLQRNELTAELLRQTTRDVAHDTVIRGQVRNMRQVLRDAGGTPRAAEALLDYVSM